MKNSAIYSRGKHMVRRTVTTIFLIFLGADISLAGPKEDCTIAVGHLGSRPIDFRRLA